MVLANLAWVCTAMLLLITLASVAGGAGWVPLNPLFGIRTRATKRSAAAWRAGHRAAILPSVVSLVAVALLSAIGLGAALVNWAAIIGAISGVVWLVSTATRAARDA